MHSKWKLMDKGLEYYVYLDFCYFCSWMEFDAFISPN